jgi:glycosyltransferase involved in cell wall biosynthesis
MSAEILWLGSGDLRGVLLAQPVPRNLRQDFAPIPGAAELAALLSRCGLLVVPSLSDGCSAYIAEAMAAGLPVLGSVHDTLANKWIVQNKTGWLFDPLRGEEMSAALSAALTATPAHLDKMRVAARARFKEIQFGLSGGNTARSPRRTTIHPVADRAPA